jgi:hypothetical protein
LSTQILIITFCAFVLTAAGRTTDCPVCQTPIFGQVVVYTDKVKREKVDVCRRCSDYVNECFACSLPVPDSGLHLPDDRHFCERDAKTAVLNVAKAKQISLDVYDKLERLFARFTSFPTNLHVEIIDRVDLLAFKVPGNDYSCPNILGLCRSETNSSGFEHHIRIMSGLTASTTRTTSAHEYCHAWVRENVTAARAVPLARDAEEGFCELVSYLLARSENDEAGQAAILANGYTRGQINWFVAAESKFGFNDILDWVKHGTQAQLTRDLHRVRDVNMPVAKEQPKAPLTPTITIAALGENQPEPSAATLALKGIGWRQSRPWALINNQTFFDGESAKVRLGGTNLVVRCLAIGTNSVRIQIPDSGEELELALRVKP